MAHEQMSTGAEGLRFYVVEEYDEPGMPPIQILGEYLGVPDADGNVWLPFLGEESVSRGDLLLTPAGRGALARWETRDDRAFLAFLRLRAERDPTDVSVVEAIERAAFHIG